jgi:hypothetical protein
VSRKPTRMFRPTGSGFQMSHDEAKYYSARANRGIQNAFRWLVDGRAMTTREVAAEIGTAFKVAQERMTRERRTAPRVTLARLRLTDKEAENAPFDP